MEESQLAIQQPSQITAFSNTDSFESAQRMAIALSSSTIVPESYRGKSNLGNCLIALEIAQRLGASPMAVMQNLYIVHGKPSWSAQFIIAAVNSTGKYSPLRFEMTGEGDKKQCVAWALELGTEQRLESPAVTMAMAKAEGWIDKNGSKWKTMPDLMLRYRSATFFGRLYAPEVLLGMKTSDEVEDMHGAFNRKARIVELEAPKLETRDEMLAAVTANTSTGNAYGVTLEQVLSHFGAAEIAEINDRELTELTTNWPQVVADICKEESK